jgi:hypothetical protein
MARNVATSTTVSLPDLLSFVRPRHRMLLATTRGDGRPQMSPVSGGVDEAGRIVISSYPSRAKTRNAERDPHTSVLVLSDEWDGAWVQAMALQDKSLIRITPTRWSPIATGGFPADVAARLDAL